MSLEVKVPAAGESITSANVARWHKAEGESVRKGEVLVTLETDKVSTELESPADGILHIVVGEGEEVAIGTVIAKLDESAAGSAGPQNGSPSPAAVPAAAPSPAAAAPASGQVFDVKVPAAGESITSANVARWHKGDGAAVAKGEVLVTLETDKVSSELEAEVAGTLQILVSEGNEVGIGTLIARITAGAPGTAGPQTGSPTPAPATAAVPKTPAPAAAPAPVEAPKPRTFELPPANPPSTISHPPSSSSDGRTTRKKMSMMRRKIATHLVNAQQTAAILTTFNEADMSAVMDLRKAVQEEFMKKHGVKLGFMSFFVKAVVQALKDVPQVNGMIDGQDIVENHFYDIEKLRPDRTGHPRLRQEVEGRQDRHRGPARRRLHHFQRRHLRLAAQHADPQPAPERHPRHAYHSAAPGRGEQPGGHPPDDVSGAQLRPPPRRRQGSRDLPDPHQGLHRESDALDARDVRGQEAGPAPSSDQGSLVRSLAICTGGSTGVPSGRW